MNQLAQAQGPSCPHGAALAFLAPVGTLIDSVTARFPCGCRQTLNGAITAPPEPPKPSIFQRQRKRADFAPR